MLNTNVCQEVSIKVAPVVDRNKCEGKEDCVRVCPYDVFSVQTISLADRSQLSLKKAWVHGWKQAYVDNPQACHACKLCISACPEKALKMASLEIMDTDSL